MFVSVLVFVLDNGIPVIQKIEVFISNERKPVSSIGTSITPDTPSHEYLSTVCSASSSLR